MRDEREFLPRYERLRVNARLERLPRGGVHDDARDDAARASGPFNQLRQQLAHFLPHRRA